MSTQDRIGSDVVPMSYVPGSIFRSQRLVDDGEEMAASLFRSAVPLATGSPGTGETSSVRICAAADPPKHRSNSAERQTKDNLCVELIEFLRGQGRFAAPRRPCTADEFSLKEIV